MISHILYNDWINQYACINLSFHFLLNMCNNFIFIKRKTSQQSVEHIPWCTSDLTSAGHCVNHIYSVTYNTLPSERQLPATSATGQFYISWITVNNRCSMVATHARFHQKINKWQQCTVSVVQINSRYIRHVYATFF